MHITQIRRGDWLTYHSTPNEVLTVHVQQALLHQVRIHSYSTSTFEIPVPADGNIPQLERLGSDKRPSSTMWTDAEVIQLLTVRGEYIERQRVNLQKPLSPEDWLEYAKAEIIR